MRFKKKKLSDKKAIEQHRAEIAEYDRLCTAVEAIMAARNAAPRLPGESITAYSARGSESPGKCSQRL